jgi:hypothetical protein
MIGFWIWPRTTIGTLKRINELAAANYKNENHPLPADFAVMDYNIYVLLISHSQKVPRI